MAEGHVGHPISTASADDLRIILLVSKVAPCCVDKVLICTGVVVVQDSYVSEYACNTVCNLNLLHSNVVHQDISSTETYWYQPLQSHSFLTLQWPY